MYSSFFRSEIVVLLAYNHKPVYYFTFSNEIHKMVSVILYSTTENHFYLIVETFVNTTYTLLPNKNVKFKFLKFVFHVIQLARLKLFSNFNLVYI